MVRLNEKDRTGISMMIGYSYRARTHEKVLYF